MMRGKIFKYVSNIAFGLGVVLAAIVLYISITARMSGACPLSSNLGLIIPAIALLAIAFITSFFAEKPSKSHGRKIPPESGK
jgi:hypothetical protein